MPAWIPAFLVSAITAIVNALKKDAPPKVEPSAPAWGSIDEREDAEIKRRKTVA